MNSNQISASISAAEKQEVHDAIQTLKSKLPFLIALNTAERKRIRKMGPAGVPYVRNIYNAATNNPGAISSGFSMQEYEKDFILYNDMTDIISWLLPLYNAIDDTYVALGNELMKQSDECYGYLKIAAQKSSNQALTDTVRNISVLLKKSSRRQIRREDAR